MQVWQLLLIIVVVVAAVLAVLYFLGKRAEKKQNEQQEQIEAAKQTVSMTRSVCPLISPDFLRWSSIRLPD